MYLSKQWRESRVISGIAILGLVLLLFGVTKATLKIDSIHGQGNDPHAFASMFVVLFYIEMVLVSFWGWLVASIGTGKNLGEDSGSFLFTRPRRRAWFLWNDWGFGIVQLALIILLSNLVMGFFLNHIRMLMHLSSGVVLTQYGDSIPMSALLFLIGVCVLLFSGLIYSLTYFSTIVVKRMTGVILGAGIFVGYMILRAVIGHYYPSIQLPNPVPNLFKFENHRFYGFSGHLGLSLLARTAVMLAFPIAAQVILDRSEI